MGVFFNDDELDSCLVAFLWCVAVAWVIFIFWMIFLILIVLIRDSTDHFYW